MELQLSNIEGNNFATSSNAYQVFDTTNDSDVFELVIDGLILEKYSDDKNLKSYIRSLPRENKRIATLSVLGDDNVLWSKMNEILKKSLNSYDRLEEIYLLLKEYVKIEDFERNQHVKVLTSFKELAEAMIKLLDKYDSEFWKNKDHKVLDSSAGYGTFLILAAYKFMVGLKDEFPDEEVRLKWIVENCLYYCEIQSKSVFSWLVTIDPFDIYKTNIYWGDFFGKDFDEHVENVWKIKEGWDLIIQNPHSKIRKDGFKKNRLLWHLFVQKSLTLLKEGGYMIMTRPENIGNVDEIFKETQNLLKDSQFDNEELNNVWFCKILKKSINFWT